MCATEDKALQPFPARIEFVYVSSAHFIAKAPPPDVTGEGGKAAAPNTWKLEFGYESAGGAKYVLTLGATAEFAKDVEQPPYELSLELVAGVRVAEGVNEDFVKQWLDKGARYLLMPYARSALSGLMEGTGFPIPYLPLVAVPILYGAAEPAEAGEEVPGEAEQPRE